MRPLIADTWIAAYLINAREAANEAKALSVLKNALMPTVGGKGLFNRARTSLRIRKSHLRGAPFPAHR
jgi:hypothetical protein